MALEGKRFLGGHTKTVLSIASRHHPSDKIVSGAESGQLAVWTPDGINLHQQCIGEGDVTAIAFSVLNPDVFYAACGNKICCLDLRQMTEAPVFELEPGDEEINQIALSENENFMAAADDSGNIQILNLTTKKVYKTLRKHTNICATVCFRPRRQWDLVSGAYDNKLILWDFSKSRSYCVMNMQEIGTVPDGLESYLVSPPFVHSIAISATGNTLACGTENALVQIFDSSKKNLRYQNTLRHHTQGVSQVHFPKFSDDKYVVSGGNDGRICIWDLEEEPKKEVYANGGSFVGSAEDEIIQPVQAPAFEVEHEEKINWISSGVVNNSKFLAVADNSCCPIIFSVPI